MVVIDDQDRVILDNHMYKALVSDLDKASPQPIFYSCCVMRWGIYGSIHISNEQGFINREFKVEGKGSRERVGFLCRKLVYGECSIMRMRFFENASKQYLILAITDITRQHRQMEELHLQTLKTIMSEDERVRSIRETLLGAMPPNSNAMNQIRRPSRF